MRYGNEVLQWLQIRKLGAYRRWPSASERSRYMHIFLDNATTPRRVPLARKYDAKAVWRGDFASQGVRQELSVFCEEQDMSESPPEPTKRHAGYAVLEEDGTIVRLERNRWIANEVADRLPGRRVVPLWILDDGDDNEQTLDI